jgi:ABC-type molybdate transport system substrate-binding protein
VVDLPELAAGRAEVAVGILSCSRDANSTQRFVDYLAAPEHGQAVFRQLGYTIAGDSGQ